MKYKLGFLSVKMGSEVLRESVYLWRDEGPKNVASQCGLKFVGVKS